MKVIIQCSSRKTEALGEVPAAERYAGKVFVTSLRVARQLVPERDIRILSAKFGLLTTDVLIPAYDVKLTPDRLQDLVNLMQLQSAHWRQHGESIRYFLTKDYAELARLVWPHGRSEFAGSRGGISQLARLYALLKSEKSN